MTEVQFVCGQSLEMKSVVEVTESRCWSAHTFSGRVSDGESRGRVRLFVVKGR